MPDPYTIPGPADQRIPEGANLAKFVLFVLLLQLDFALMDALWHGFGADWPRLLRIALTGVCAVGNGMLIIGLGVLAHDAVHRVLFRAPLANEAVGGMAAAIMLVPFCANRQFHLTHHSYAHQPGLDPENDMHERPFWQAATQGSVAGLRLQYGIFLRNLAARRDIRPLQDLAFLVFGVAFYVLAPLALGYDLLVSVVPTILAFPLVFSFRALSDHYGLPAVARRSQRRQDVIDGSDWFNPKDRAQVTGWVVLTQPWLEWLWSSVNYHEVHHKYPYLSHVHLRAVFEHTRDRHPYRVAHGYCASLLNLSRRPYYEEPERARAPAVEPHAQAK